MKPKSIKILIDLVGIMVLCFSIPLGICTIFSVVEYSTRPEAEAALELPAIWAFLVATGIAMVGGLIARMSTGFAFSSAAKAKATAGADDEHAKPGVVEDRDREEEKKKQQDDAKLLDQLGRREAILLVVSCYFVASLISAIPFMAWSLFCDRPEAVMFSGVVNPWFEAMSGITTCGATILPDIEILPRSILFWRSFIQWVGGIGFVVLFVHWLPILGVGGKKMFFAESTGPSPQGLRPHVSQTGRFFVRFYLALSLAAMLLLMVCGMNWFDAICHCFTTVATAGFSTRNASIAAFDSLSIELVVMFFMLASGVGFALYYRVITGGVPGKYLSMGNWELLRNLPRLLVEILRIPRQAPRMLKPLRESKELHLYLLLALLITAICTVSMVWSSKPILLTTGEEVQSGFLNSLRYAAFGTISILTTTGYTAAAYETWPALAIVALMSIYIVGGMAGSTAGGMKIIRVWIAGKMLLSSIEKEYDPKVVRAVRIGKSPVPSETRTMVLVFVMFTLLLIAVGCAMLEMFEGTEGIDFTSSLTAAASAVANVGPGLSKVGADDTYAFLSAPSKLTLTVLMLMGRVELLMVLALFTRRFWSRG